jgi:hypothetical protein
MIRRVLCSLGYHRFFVLEGSLLKCRDCWFIRDEDY